MMDLAESNVLTDDEIERQIQDLPPEYWDLPVTEQLQYVPTADQDEDVFRSLIVGLGDRT